MSATRGCVYVQLGNDHTLLCSNTSDRTVHGFQMILPSATVVPSEPVFILRKSAVRIPLDDGVEVKRGDEIRVTYGHKGVLIECQVMLT